MGTRRAKSAARIGAREIDRRIERILAVDLRVASIGMLVPLIQSAMGGYSCYTQKIEMEAAFRARYSSSSPFSKVSELWYPPSSVVIPSGRLNEAGQAIFYCADSLDVAIIEMHPKPGDRITILKCLLKDPATWPHVMELGVPELAGQHNPRVGQRILENTVGGRRVLKTDKRIASNYKVRSFLRDQFLRVVKKGDEHEYAITQAIARVFLESDTIDGFWYPSVAIDYKGTNCALKPTAADRLLKAEHVWEVLVEEEIERNVFMIRDLSHAKSIELDGTIVW